MDDIKIGEILEPGDGPEQEKQEQDIRTKFWRTAKRAAKRIPFMDEVVAAYFCAMDPETPTKVRGILLAALAYFVLPFDFIPDFIAVFGFGDDMSVLMAALATIAPHIKEHHRAAARAAMEDEDIAV